MNIEEINIDEQLSILWTNVYDAILNIIDIRYTREFIVELPNSLLLSYVLVTYDGVIRLCTSSGYVDYAEQFEDEFLYDAYRQLVPEIKS